MKIVVFCVKSHWNLFPGVQLKQQSNIGSDNGLVLNRGQAFYFI